MTTATSSLDRDPNLIMDCDKRFDMNAAKSISIVPVSQDVRLTRAITHASHALKVARGAHQDRVMLATQAQDRGQGVLTAAQPASLNSDELVREIGFALEADRVCLALQPVVSSIDHSVAFHECLMRLEQLDGGELSTGASIQAAEDNGLSTAIDRRSLSLAGRILAAAPELRLSLNVSALTCRDSGWTGALETMLHENPAFAGRLIIEITETAEIEDLHKTREFVDIIKSFGCQIALDDFGAGYTSFDSLTGLAIDILKIDGAYVRDIKNNPADRDFVAALVDIARQLNIKTVAEWVVDRETAEIIRDLGVCYMQGYYFGEPQASEKVIASSRG